MKVFRILGLLTLLTTPAVAQVIDTQQVSTASTGACNTNACAVFQIGLNPSVTLQVSGTFSGTLTFETTSDNAHWVATGMLSLTDMSSISTTTTTSGQFALVNSGVLQVRARATSWASGLATVVATAGRSPLRLGGGGGGGGGITALTGDVTASGSGSVAATLADDVVATAKIQNLAVTVGKLAGSITAAKLVGTDITTVGTIGTGTWAATTIACNKGGTGQTSFTDGQLLIGNSSSGCLSKASLTAGTNITITPGNGSITIDAASSSGATTALDNLASVSINTALIPQANVDLGATGTPFRDLFLFGGGSFGTTSIRLTGIPTGNRVLTLPNATDTLVGKATTDTFTGKSYDTAGSGNVFKINGTTISAVSGTGAVCLASGSACGGSSTVPTYLSKTANYTLVASTDFPTIGTVECLTNACTFTLPTAVGIDGQTAILKNIQTANLLTLNTTSGQTIDGSASGSITVSNNCLAVQSNGANYKIVGGCGFGLSSLGTVNTVLHGSASPAYSAVALADMATQANNTVLANISGGSAIPAAVTGLPVPTPLMYVAGVSQANTASITCNTGNSGAATATTAATTTMPLGVMSFSGSGQNDVHCLGFTPADWTSSSQMDITLYWRAAATSGDVVWSVSTLFAGDGTNLNGGYNTASTVTDTAKGTTLQVNTATITSVTSTGIGASKIFSLDIGRNGGVGSDTMSGAAEIIGWIVTIRRTPTIGG